MPRLIITMAILVGLAGVSHGEMRTSQHDARASVQLIGTVIKTYGKRAIIRFILKQTSGRITLHVGNELRTFYGVPDPVYVTPRTILRDLRALGVIVGELAKRLQHARPREHSAQRPLEAHPLAQHATPRDRRAHNIPEAHSEAVVKPLRAPGEQGPRRRKTGVYMQVHEDFEAPSKAVIPSAVGFYNSLSGMPRTQHRAEEKARTFVIPFKTLGISYRQMMETLSGVFLMEEVPLEDGSPRYRGHTADGRAVLEIVGDKDDISSTVLLFAPPTHARMVPAHTRALLLRFLHNAVPEWPETERAAWATVTFRQVAWLARAREKVLYGHKVITISSVQPFGLIGVSVTPE